MISNGDLEMSLQLKLLAANEFSANFHIQNRSKFSSDHKSVKPPTPAAFMMENIILGLIIELIIGNDLAVTDQFVISVK